jgi:hypothetical protein
VDHLVVGSKFTIVASWLQAAGYEPLFVATHPDVVAPIKQAGYPVILLELQSKDMDLIPAAKDFVAHMQTPITGPRNAVIAPTLGELIGYDDFLGGAHAYRIAGADAFRADAIISPIRGAESQTPPDSALALQMWRYCRANRIPHIGIEISPLEHQPIRLEQWPVDVLLTHNDPRTYSHLPAPLAFRMPVSHRHVFSLSTDATMAQFVQEQEPRLRAHLGGPNSRYLFFPFHLAFKSRWIAMLQALNTRAEKLQAQHVRLVIPVDRSNHRRNYTEHDMIVTGCAQWLKPWEGHLALIEQAGHIPLGLLSEAVCACFESAMLPLCEAAGQPVIRPGQEDTLDDLSYSITIPQAVAYALEHLTTGGETA